MHIKNTVFTAPLALLVCGTVILAGCMNGVYTVSSSIDYDAKYNGLNYEVIKDDTASFDNRIFQEDCMPIIVKEDKNVSKDEYGVTMLLWGLTFGVIPYYHSSSSQYKVIVKSPIGTKMQSIRSILEI